MATLNDKPKLALVAPLIPFVPVVAAIAIPDEEDEHFTTEHQADAAEGTEPDRFTGQIEPGQFPFEPEKIEAFYSDRRRDFEFAHIDQPDTWAG